MTINFTSVNQLKRSLFDGKSRALLGICVLVLSCMEPAMRRPMGSPQDADDEGGMGGGDGGRGGSMVVEDAGVDASNGGRGGSASGGAGSGGSAGAPGSDASTDAPVPPDSSARDSGVEAPIAAVDVRAADLRPPADMAVNNPMSEYVWRWRFDEGTGIATADSSGRGNTGLLTGSAKWVVGGAPIPNNPFSLSFNGSNSYVAVEQDLVSVLGRTASLAFWMKTSVRGNPDPPDAPGITGVMDDSGNNNNLSWGFIDGMGLIGIKVGNATSTRSTKSVTDNAWHHIVLTRNMESGRVQIFVDGSLSKAGDAVPGEKRMSFTGLGRIVGSTSPYYNGWLDDVRVWDRVLTNAEVAALTAAP